MGWAHLNCPGVAGQLSIKIRNRHLKAPCYWLKWNKEAIQELSGAKASFNPHFTDTSAPGKTWNKPGSETESDVGSETSSAGDTTFNFSVLFGSDKLSPVFFFPFKVWVEVWTGLRPLLFFRDTTESVESDVEVVGFCKRCQEVSLNDKKYVLDMRLWCSTNLHSWLRHLFWRNRVLWYFLFRSFQVVEMIFCFLPLGPSYFSLFNVQSAVRLRAGVSVQHQRKDRTEPWLCFRIWLLAWFRI